MRCSNGSLQDAIAAMLRCKRLRGSRELTYLDKCWAVAAQ
jgi:hypothetical protein